VQAIQVGGHATQIRAIDGPQGVAQRLELAAASGARLNVVFDSIAVLSGGISIEVENEILPHGGATAG
jgi:hypothetical protein